MYNDKEEEAVRLASTLVKWGLKTILKIFAWLLVIEILIGCATFVITKCTKIEREVKIEKNK